MSIVQILIEKGKTEGGIAQLFGRAGITAEDFTCNMLKINIPRPSKFTLLTTAI